MVDLNMVDLVYIYHTRQHVVNMVDLVRCYKYVVILTDYYVKSLIQV